MVISREKKYIYIAVPKTGTTSVQELLLDNDASALKNCIYIAGKKHLFHDHISAGELKKVMGEEEFKKFKVFGFVRNPYGRMVSSYHFYKKGGKYWIWDGREKKRPFLNKMKILFAKTLPFKVWAVLYPYKSNIEFLTEKDKGGETLAHHIGIFENLQEELKRISCILNLDLNIENLPFKNKSKHDEYNLYFTPSLFKWIVKIKMKKDLVYYNQILQKNKIKK